MNRYGVDDNYFRKKLESVIASLHNYTPEELSRELYRLASTASAANQPSQPVAAQPDPIAKFFRYNRGGSGEFIGVEWLIPEKTVPDEGYLILKVNNENS